MRGEAIGALLWVMVVSAEAQWDPRGVRAVGMVGCSDTVMWIGQGNPAATSLRERGSISVAWVPGHFGLTELQRYGIGASMRMGDWGSEVHLLSYGASLFQMRSFRAIASRRVSTASSIGVQIGIRRWSTGAYPAVWEWGYGAGFLMKQHGLLVGGRIRSIGTKQTGPKVEVCTGLTVEMASTFSLTTELMQISGEPLTARYSCVIALVDALQVVGGWQDDPHMVGMGLSLRVNGLELSFGGNWHGVLGWTHALGAGINL